MAAVVAAGLATAPAVRASCAAPANAIVAENCKTGAPAGDWDIAGAGDGSVQGFATDISVAQGDRVEFRIEANAAYRLDVYRLGWYDGAGARMVGSVGDLAPQAQPSCPKAADTGLVKCDWAISATWDVPPSATSGIYLGVAVRNGVPVGHIPFVVRDDDGGSDLLFQTSDTTWQAYNRYGGSSLYAGGPGPQGGAYKVSYDRPFTTASDSAEDSLFNAEYPMVRWLERNGYDVSYFTGVDGDRRGAEIREHRAFLSVGHDEYWSGGQRANVEAARDAGVSLAFFSGNEMFWKTRWEDGHRTLVAYKETHANAKVDPLGNVWTGTWRDPRFSPPADGGRPENALTGQLFTVNSGTTAIAVPTADGMLRLWRGAELGSGTATLTDGTLGYEWDEDVDNGARPAGLMHLSSTTVDGVDKLRDYGSTFAPGTATHHLTLYRDTNDAGPDALVFGAGTVQWSWGLDSVHERGNAPPSAAMQQATTNLFADMGVQPASLQSGLQPATASTDETGPSASVAAADATRSVTAATPATVHGSASDAGGGRVAAVEVSVDGGATWHPADGREQWSYTWTPAASGPVTALARAADDSGNLTGAGPAAPGGAPAGAAPAGAVGSVRRRGRSSAAAVVGRRRVRMSRTGRVRLRVRCPAGEHDCRVRLRLRRARHVIAARTLTVRAGDTRRVALKLRRGARRKLISKRSLRVTAVVASGGHRTRRSIRLLAPRRAR